LPAVLLKIPMSHAFFPEASGVKTIENKGNLVFVGLEKS
jgi:hypothetical protein